MRKVFLGLIVLSGLGIVECPSASAQSEAPTWKWYEVKDGKVQLHLHVFWSLTCPHCTKAHGFLAELKKRHDWLKVIDYEVTRNPANMDLYRQMAASINRQAGQVPAFFHCKQLDIGFDSDATTGKRLEDALIRCRTALQKQVDDRRKSREAAQIALATVLLPPENGSDPVPELDELLELELPPPEKPVVDIPGWGTVNADEVSLPLLTVVLGGLDAFNPCAFFVLMILLSLMLRTGSVRKMLLIGGVFVFASGLVYFLSMAAWLNLFFLIGHLRLLTVIAGAVALAAAAVNIKDYFFFKEGVSLSLSQSARSRLIQRMNILLRRSSWLPLLAGTASLAFTANLYELLCTSGLPMVYVRVLTLHELTGVEYYGYLLLYNVIYVLPLVMIVSVFALTSTAYKLTEYHGRILKLISGLLMLSLGAILLIDPAFLNNLAGAVTTLVASIATGVVVVLVHRAVLRKRTPPPATLGT